MPGEINDQVLEYSFCYTIHEVWPLLGSAVVLPELFLNWGCFRLPWTRKSCHSLFSGSLSSSFYTEIVSLDFSHINVHLWCFSLQEAAWTFFPALQLCSSLFCPLCLLQPRWKANRWVKNARLFPFLSLASLYNFFKAASSVLPQFYRSAPPFLLPEFSLESDTKSWTQKNLLRAAYLRSHSTPVDLNLTSSVSLILP